MRLLTVGNRYPPWSLGGYEVVWHEAVQAWRRRGHAVRVLTTLPDPSDLPSEPAVVPADVHRELGWYWRAHTFPRRSWRATVALERHNARVLERHLAAFAPDAVVWWAMGGMSLSLLEQVHRAGRPALGVVGDAWMAYGPQVDDWLRRWQRVPRALAAVAAPRFGAPATVDLDRVARWAFNSEFLRAQARALGWRMTDSCLLPPGVDPDRFRFAPADTWRGQLLCLGRIDRRKGVLTAARALGELPEAELRVEGTGEPEVISELWREAAAAGASTRLRLGQSAHDGVPAVIAACDVVLFPVEWEEPWGLVPLEAMAIGRPVIATRAGGGAAEYLRDEVNCLLVAPADPRALAGAVRRLAGDPALRARLVAGGRETAARYSAAMFHEGLESELLASAGRRAQPSGLPRA